MAGIRRALLWASTSKYLNTLINLVTTVIVARLLTPEEYGISVLGLAVYAMAESLRELGGGAYLIQRKVLERDQIQTTFTVNCIVTLVISVVLAFLAGPLARFYGRPELTNFLLLVALWYALGPFVYPVIALMGRGLEFGKVAIITIAVTFVNSTLTILLAFEGFSYMSFAWAALASGVVGMLVGLYLWADLSIFRFRIREWREVLTFSAYDSAAAVFLRLWESAPYIILGKFLNMEAVGVFQRAFTVCLFPERVIMAGVGAIALPAFSEQVRQGKALKDGYMAATSHITGLQWPTLIVLALLAHPVVLVLLGSQWLDTIPLIRILCVAMLFYFPLGLNYPALIAVGAIRFLPPLVFLQAVVSLGALSFAAQYGLQAVVVSMLITMPLIVFMSMLLLRHHIPFTWTELALAMRKSAVISMMAAAGPLVVVSIFGWSMSIGAAVLAVVLAGSGWLAGIWLTQHPILQELSNARTALLRFSAKWIPTSRNKFNQI